MLSILPALLLLIFRGPTVADGAHLGRVSPMGEAIYRNARTQRSALQALASHPVLAKLFCRLLEPSNGNAVAVSVYAAQKQTALPFTPSSLRQGFSKSERTRDGPVRL